MDMRTIPSPAGIDGPRYKLAMERFAPRAACIRRPPSQSMTTLTARCRTVALCIPECTGS